MFREIHVVAVMYALYMLCFCSCDNILIWVTLLFIGIVLVKF